MSTPMNWPPFLTFLTSQNLSSRPHPCLNSERPAFKSARRVNDSPLMDLMLERENFGIWFWYLFIQETKYRVRFSQLLWKMLWSISLEIVGGMMQ